MMRTPTQRRRVLLTFVVLALLLTLGAIRPIHAAPSPQEGDDAALRVINESEETICYVLISPVTSDEWGDDWLDENETIPPGETRAFDVMAGDYDVRLADCDGNILLTERLTVAGQYELRYAPGPDKVLLDQATAKLNEESYADALRLFQELVTTYPDSTYASVAQYGIAACYYGMGEMERAKQALQTVIENYPDSAYATQAQQDLQTLEQSPAATPAPEADSSCDTLNQEGMTLYRQAQYQDAIQKFQEALTCYREIGDRAGEGAYAST